jgi:AraC family transcriptional regulator
VDSVPDQSQHDFYSDFNAISSRCSNRGHSPQLMTLWSQRSTSLRHHSPEFAASEHKMTQLASLRQNRAKHSGFGKDAGPVQRLEGAPNAQTKRLNGEARSMSCKPVMRDPLKENQLDSSGAHPRDLPVDKRRPADVEMARVLKTAPLRVASDPSNGTIAYWKHGALHDVVEPMADHVVMTYTGSMQRLERRSGKSVAIGTARSGVVTIIPAGSSARWDIPGLVNVIQLYLPHRTLERVAGEADTATPSDLLERTGHPDPITSRLLASAADVLEGSAALDALFRQQLTDLLATRLLAAHTGSSAAIQPAIGGLSPMTLRRAIERLRADSDADVSLGALASDAGLSRFHFCRAFKESTGLSPHAWLRQHRLEQAMNMLRDTDASVVSVAAALGYSSQTAFAAAFRKLTGETPSDWRRRIR